MVKTQLKPATLQIFSGTVRNVLNQFLIERRSRGLSPNTIRFYTLNLERFCTFLDSIGLVQFDELTADIIRKFLLQLEGQGHNPGGIHGYYRCIRAMLTWWEEELDGDYRSPMQKVKPPKNPFKSLPGVALEDVRKMINACNTNMVLRDRAILLCLLDTGVRAAEFLALDIKDIDYITGAVYVAQGKGGKSRTVYLCAKTRKTIRKYLKIRENIKPKDPLWITDDGERLQFSGLRQIIERRAAGANVECPGLHDFRRTFAITMHRNGVDIMTISRLLGHSSVAVTQRYLAQIDPDLMLGHRQGSPVDHVDW